MSSPEFPFQRQPLHDSRLQDRLLRRPRQDNAVIELRNRFADGLERVAPGDVQKIEASYRVDFSRDFHEERSQMLEAYLVYCYADGTFDEQERQRANHLQVLLRLDSGTATAIHQQVKEGVYRDTVKEHVEDRRLTPEEVRRSGRTTGSSSIE
ncbi:MAG: hypothetical protein R2849_17350 [Thermomicrobiales bacterium]